MAYRTRTYIAGDWDHDFDLIGELYRRNESDYYTLSFSDAHDLTQARDTSLPCSIKQSLALRMDASKTFVLVVGEHTAGLTKGSCQHCRDYCYGHCMRGRSVSHASFVEYECDKAARDGLRIVVLYNGMSVNRQRCPEPLRQLGVHEPAYEFTFGSGRTLRYQAIKRLICQ